MLATGAQHFIRMESLICKLRVLFVSLERLLANHIRNKIVHKLGLRFTLSFLSNSDCNMWKTLNI
jgi:hypothetical protein